MEPCLFQWLRKILVCLRSRKLTGGWKKCGAMKSLIICTVLQLLIGIIESASVWCGACRAHGSENVNAIIHLENLTSIRTKLGCECMDWVYLAQDRVRLLAARVLQKADRFFTSKATHSWYRRTLLYGIRLWRGGLCLREEGEQIWRQPIRKEPRDKSCYREQFAEKLSLLCVVCWSHHVVRWAY